MTRILALLLFLGSVSALSADSHGKKRVYEMRTYFAHPGKLDALHARFRDHTCALFEKHGIKNVGYWVPIENTENKLVYLVSYPSREAREKSWQGFRKDPAWTAAYKNSTKDGKLVARITSQFFTPTDYSPELKIMAHDPGRLFELRVYTTNKGKLTNLNARFRDHTCALFEKHGISNVIYLDLMEQEKGAGTTLTYFIAHKDADARKASWMAFGSDPDWKAARKASVADGAILIKGGVKAELLKPTEYSPLK